jgi:hypothetical protein
MWHRDSVVQPCTRGDPVSTAARYEANMFLDDRTLKDNVSLTVIKQLKFKCSLRCVQIFSRHK